MVIIHPCFRLLLTQSCFPISLHVSFKCFSLGFLVSMYSIICTPSLPLYVLVTLIFFNPCIFCCFSIFSFRCILFYCKYACTPRLLSLVLSMFIFTFYVFFLSVLDDALHRSFDILYFSPLYKFFSWHFLPTCTPRLRRCSDHTRCAGPSVLRAVESKRLRSCTAAS